MNDTYNNQSHLPLCLRSSLRMAAVAAFVAGSAFVGTTAGQAASGTVAVDSAGNLQIGGGAGNVNLIGIRVDGSRYKIVDTGDGTLTPGKGCKLEDEAIFCGTKGVKKILISLGDKDDKLSANVPTPVAAHGNSGSDVLRGGALSGPMTLFGDAGNDTLIGGWKNDVFHGGGGNDVFRGARGTDTVTYEKLKTDVVVRLDDKANDGPSTEKDNVTSTVENITGGQAGDLLVGNDSKNRIWGLGGGDTIDGRGKNDSLTGHGGGDDITGGEGVDAMTGNAGIDTLRAKDGTKDSKVDGGAGDDTCFTDPVDPRTSC